MNKQQFDSLPEKEKALVAEAYIDGYNAAIESVKHMIQRIGDEKLDALFISNRNSIIHMLETGRPK